MDTLIRDETLECGAELCTSDVLQHKAAQAQGVTTRLLTEKSDAEMKFCKYFDQDDEHYITNDTAKMRQARVSACTAGDVPWKK